MKSRTSLLVIALAVLAGPLAAQVGTTTDVITGRVTGPTGEPLSAAAVSAISLETGVRRSVLTTPQGRYTIVFPDGGGRYRLEVTYLGMSAVSRLLGRVGDEDVLVADLHMEIAPLAIEGVHVTAARRDDPMRREPGSTDRVLPGEALERLPIDMTDPSQLAALSPGVVGIEGSDTTAAGFSVFGQGPGANQVTLDGLSFGAGAGGLDLPQEAVRFARVVTNSYDVARGQFSGGQVASTTRSGTNRNQGSFSYSLRDPNLQWTEDDSPFGGGFRQDRVSGGFGGPIIRDRLFYFGSFAAQRRSEGLQSLVTASPLALQRMGAHPDSVVRFLGIVGDLGVYPAGVGTASERLGDALTLLGRVDYTLTPAHTLTLRGDGRWSRQEGFRVGSLGVPLAGGEMSTRSGGAMATLTSRFGAAWINEMRAYMSGSERSLNPYVSTPEGRVRMSSELDDGSRSVSTLTFGGSSIATTSRESGFELANELSWLADARHRVRLGGVFSASRTTQSTAQNRLGTFTFASLEDLEAGRPSAFTRALASRERSGGGWNAALYAGDTFRPSQQLQLTYGVRLEGSSVFDRPEHNPAVETAFGRRTDEVPGEVYLSPRVGFSYVMGAGEGRQPLGTIRGGVGAFRARPPFAAFSAALDATGLPDGVTQLYCVGEAVPVPDWESFRSDLSAIPSECAGAAAQMPVSGRGVDVTLFDRGFGAPVSWRGSLGMQRRVLGTFALSLDGTYAMGMRQQGVRDLNLDATPRFTLDSEGGRPVFVEAASIVPSTGQVSLLRSRQVEGFGHVMELHSELRSHTAQATMGVSGMIPQWRLLFQSSYTLGRSVDQGSSASPWGFGGGRMGSLAGGGVGQLPSTAGDPGRLEWAPSNFDRRHSLLTTLGRQMRPWMDVTLIGRASSGAPFTPMVGGDINGDGARNDRAFVFDPATAPDAQVAAGMQRLLEGASPRVRSCLEEQLGTVAERNSCRNSWTHSLDLRASLRPTLPRLGQRLSISLDAVNTLGGLDRLLHGSAGMRGWGQSGRADPVLLYPRGFDPAEQRFHYEVNERFGESRQGNLAFRSPFMVHVQGQIRLGAVQQQRAGGVGGRGGAGMRGAVIGGGAGGPGGGVGFDPAALLDRLLTNPVSAILGMQDSLRLSPEQIASLRPVSELLDVRNQAMRELFLEEAGRPGAQPIAQLRALQPRLEEVRAYQEEALGQAQEILTPAQWEQVPANVRTPPTPRMGGERGGQRGPRQP